VQTVSEASSQSIPLCVVCSEGGYEGGYTKKSVIPVPYTVYGGWDKCIGPFSHYEAKSFGIDVWDCHSNCYTRRDPNGGEAHREGGGEGEKKERGREMERENEEESEIEREKKSERGGESYTERGRVR
jgi:hypothetical protein